MLSDGKPGPNIGADKGGNMMRFAIAVLAVLAWCVTAAAQAPINFEGKTITMIIGPPPGGGTDAAGRLIAQFLGTYLPGKPTIIVQSMPGADGVVSTNYFIQHVKADGMTITMGSSTQADPVVYRGGLAKYDATTFAYIGGIGRGGSTVVIRKDAEERLYDKSKPPVIMGTVAGVPRSGMQVTAWGIDLLGWNAKWVLGYPGTNELFIALERGEIDMTASSNLFQVEKMLQTGKVKILTQTGTLFEGKFLPRSEFGDVPVFPVQVEGKIKDPVQKQGYDYWFSLVVLDKWLALPPGTPDPILQVYREAFTKMIKDQEFQERGRRMSQDFEAHSGADVANLIKTLGQTTPAALEYIRAMLKRQGIGN
jgi:tripartite-type tricarboxylate transporter receptor subunit TctC